MPRVRRTSAAPRSSGRGAPEADERARELGRGRLPDSNDHASAARMLSFSSLSRSSHAAWPARVSSGSAVSASGGSARWRSREGSSRRSPKASSAAADGLEHAEPRLAVGLFLPDQLLSTAARSRRDLAELEAERAADDRLGGVDVRPRTKTPGGQRRPSPCRREVVAPVDRVAQRVLAAPAEYGTFSSSRKKNLPGVISFTCGGDVDGERDSLGWRQISAIAGRCASRAERRLCVLSALHEG